MDSDALLEHFFEGSDPPSSANPTTSALERLRIAFGVENEPGRKFALWTLLDAIGEAPLPAEAFAKHPQLKAAAEEYLKAAFRIERFGEE